MNWQEFEDRLGSEADAHQTPVNTDALWEKIREKQRRRWLPFFWLLAGLGLLTSGGLLVRSHLLHSNPALSEQTGQVTQADTTAHIRLPAGYAPVPGGSSAYFPPVDWRTPDHQPSGNANQRPSTPASARLGGAPDHPAVHSGLNLSKEAVRPSIGSTTQKTDEIELAPGVAVPLLPSDPEKILPQATPASMLENAASARGETAPPAGALPAIGTSLPGSRQPAALPFLFQPFIPLTLPIPQHSTPRAVPPPVVPAKKKLPVYVGLQTGYAAWQIRRGASADSSLPTRSGEKTLAAPQAGLQLQLPLGPNWSLRTGVHYTQYQSVFRWNKTWIVSDTTQPGYYQYERKVQHHNRVQSLSVPLDLQYRLALGQLSLQPFAGVQVQAWQRADGVILANTEPGGGAYRKIYKPAFNLGLRFGISAEVPLGVKTRLFLEPAGMADLLNRTSPGYAPERFRQWGVQVGVLRQW